MTCSSVIITSFEQILYIVQVFQLLPLNKEMPAG